MRQHQTTRHPAQAIEKSSQHLLWLPLACAWLLMLTTFSSPEADAANSVGTLNLLGLVKLVVRVFTFALLGFAMVRHFNNPRCPAVIRWLLPLGMFVAWALLSTLWSPLRTVSLGQASGLVVLLMLSFTLSLMWNGPRSASAILCSLSVCLLLLSVILLICYFLFPETEALRRDGAGLFHSTNAGGTASLGLLVLVAARLLWNWRWTRVLLIPGIAIYGAALLLAASRTPVFLVAALLPILYLMFANRTLVIATVVAGSIAGMTYLTLDTNLVLAEKVLQPVTAFTNQSQTKTELRELSGRSEMWQAMWASHRQAPWIGHGYFVTSRTGELEVWREWENWTAHNLILQVIVTTGLVGLALFTFGLLTPAWLLLSRMASGRADRKIAYFLMIVGAWYFLRGLLTTSFMGPIQPESVVFFSTLGIGVGSLIFADGSDATVVVEETQ